MCLMFVLISFVVGNGTWSGNTFFILNLLCVNSVTCFCISYMYNNYWKWNLIANRWVIYLMFSILNLINQSSFCKFCCWTAHTISNSAFVSLTFIVQKPFYSLPLTSHASTHTMIEIVALMKIYHILFDTGFILC